jgi:MOSC domain-containing protein YiiM
MTGTVVQVSISRGGVPKRAIPSARLTEKGVEGDAWRYSFHGGPRQAVLLITMEGVEELVSLGFPLSAGALGENITALGLDRRSLRVGQRFQVGEAEIELTSVRGPCATLNVYGAGIQAAMYDARVATGDPESPRWGLSGFYAAVTRPGNVLPRDVIVSCRKPSS